MKNQCRRCPSFFRIAAGEIHRDYCDKCLEELGEIAILDETIRLIGESLNPINRLKFKAMSREDRLLLARAAWHDGVVQWKTPSYWTPEMVERFEAFKAKQKGSA